MSIDVREIAASDEAGLTQWHGVLAAQSQERAYAVPFALAEVRAQVQRPSQGEWARPWLARWEGEVAGAGLLEFPLTDNLKVAWIEVSVLPAYRGRGVGSALLAELERVAGAADRTIFASETPYPLESDGKGRHVEWCRRRGYAEGLTSVQRRLKLAGIEPRLRGLLAEAAPHHADYRLIGWSGPAPEEHVVGLAELVSQITVEAPAGDLVLEQGSPDPDVFRDRDASLAAQGRTRHTTVALDPAGHVVGHSDLISSVHTPKLAYQWSTLVRPADRGHRLGLALKAANLLRLLDQAPQVQEVVTFNAAVNEPMIAVNDALGFVPVELLAELQKHVG